MNKRDSEQENIWAMSLEEYSPDALDAYDYSLDEAQIATKPAKRRDDSRLLVYGGDPKKRIEHTGFADLGRYLDAHDLLVFNDTEVIPARLQVFKETGGRVELFVLQPTDGELPRAWKDEGAKELSFRCMTRSSKPLRPQMVLTDPDRVGMPEFVIEAASGGQATVRVTWDGSLLALLQAFGEVPLPPYIVKQRRQMGRPALVDSDQRRYQTIYATTPGAVAAPTAGLHFTQELLERLDKRGVQRAAVTLTVGPGTFTPVRHDKLSRHEMHRENYHISPQLGDAIRTCRDKGGRVIAVGTTTTRALEAEARREVPFRPGWRTTDLFLKPGTPFQVCDGLITNFHLPRSTLLALVAGFAGYEGMRHIYEEAVGENYRFYSYGDANLIFRQSDRPTTHEGNQG